MVKNSKWTRTLVYAEIVLKSRSRLTRLPYPNIFRRLFWLITKLIELVVCIYIPVAFAQYMSTLEFAHSLLQTLKFLGW